VVDVTETDTRLCLKSVDLDNVILNDTDTFVDSVSLVDVTKTDIGLCLSSVGFLASSSTTLVLPFSLSDG
jgi:hypothetical protein